MLVPAPSLSLLDHSLTHLAIFSPSPSTLLSQIVLLKKHAGSPSGLHPLGAGGGENFEVSSPLPLVLAVPPPRAALIKKKTKYPLEQNQAGLFN